MRTTSHQAGAFIIRATGLGKVYRSAGQPLPVLDGIDLNVPTGEFLAIMGPSGSGKSTLLNLLGGVDSPTAGSLVVNGQDLGVLAGRQLAAWRAAQVGFIFQSYHLIPALTAFENIELPLLLTGLSRAERRERVASALGSLGLEHRARFFPSQLSGGQQQRVAIARAVVADPQIIVADEPTGNLDSTSRDEVMKLIAELNGSLGKTVVMVTHDSRAAAVASRTLHLDKGRLVTAAELHDGLSSNLNRMPSPRLETRFAASGDHSGSRTA